MIVTQFGRLLQASRYFAMFLGILFLGSELSNLEAATALYSLEKNGQATLLDFDPYEGSPSSVHGKPSSVHGQSSSVPEKSLSKEEGLPMTAVSLTSFPQIIAEHGEFASGQLVEAMSADLQSLEDHLTTVGLGSQLQSFQQRSGTASKQDLLEAEQVNSDTLTLVANGPSSNRIDLVFMGDGYTTADRARFFGDVQRLVDDMFRGQTFASYLPLFNVHAVFKPSRHRGIGKGRPQDTTYGLYRDGNTLRAIMPGNPRAIRNSCRQAPDCDFPVVIANDDLYGGLGGEFAIATRSPTSGTTVLRHELGHNFGRVGEEYDGGVTYGANHASSLSSIKWKHWATQLPIEAEPIKAVYLDWPWHNLKNGPYSARFRLLPGNDGAKLRFSVSGMASTESLQLLLDEEDELPLPNTSPFSEDRSFYDIDFDASFAGLHTLKFTELERDGNNWVSSVHMHQYGPGFHFSNEFVGAYPVFDQRRRPIGFRPTNEACLMRDMNSEDFCPVCQENNWLQFLKRMSLVDTVTVEQQKSGYVSVNLATPQLGQRRSFPDHTIDPADSESEHLSIRWFRDGLAQQDLDDSFSWQLPAEEAQGRWRVTVRLHSAEIKYDGAGHTKDEYTFEI